MVDIFPRGPALSDVQRRAEERERREELERDVAEVGERIEESRGGPVVEPRIRAGSRRFDIVQEGRSTFLVDPETGRRREIPERFTGRGRGGEEFFLQERDGVTVVNLRGLGQVDAEAFLQSEGQSPEDIFQRGGVVVREQAPTVDVRQGEGVFLELEESGRLDPEVRVRRGAEFVRTGLEAPESVVQSVLMGNVRPIESAATGVPTPVPDVSEPLSPRRVEREEPIDILIGDFRRRSRDAFDAAQEARSEDRTLARFGRTLEAGFLSASAASLQIGASGAQLTESGFRFLLDEPFREQTIETGEEVFATFNPFQESGRENLVVLGSNLQLSAREALERNPPGFAAEITVSLLGESALFRGLSRRDAFPSDVVDVRTLDVPRRTDLTLDFRQVDDITEIAGFGVLGGRRARFAEIGTNLGEDSISRARIGDDVFELRRTGDEGVLVRLRDGEEVERTRLVGFEPQDFDVREIRSASVNLQDDVLGGVEIEQRLQDVAEFTTPSGDFTFISVEEASRAARVTAPLTFEQRLVGGRLQRRLTEVGDVEVTFGDGDVGLVELDVSDTLTTRLPPQLLELEETRLVSATGTIQIDRPGFAESTRRQLFTAGFGRRGQLSGILPNFPDEPSTTTINIPGLRPSRAAPQQNIEALARSVRSQPQPVALVPRFDSLTGQGVSARQVGALGIQANLRASQRQNESLVGDLARVSDSISSGTAPILDVGVAQSQFSPPRLGTSPALGTRLSRPGRPARVAPLQPAGPRLPRLPSLDFRQPRDFDFPTLDFEPSRRSQRALSPRSDPLSRFFSRREFGRATDVDLPREEFQFDIFAGLIPTREQRRRERNILEGLL